MFFPAIANAALTKMRLMPKAGSIGNKTVELMLCGMTLVLALPMSIALFE